MAKKSRILLLAMFLVARGPALCFAAPAADYLCAIGTTFYQQGSYEDALLEFNKVLLLEPDNATAKEYINRIFSSQQTVPSSAQPFARNTLRQEAMSGALESLEKQNLPDPGAPAKKAEGLKVSGQLQLSFGSTPQDSAIWKRANGDLNERNYRILSDNAFDRRTNTYDPRIFDRLMVNLDTDQPQGFNLHTNITVDPWSFTGKSEKVTVPGVFGDSAEVELKYWSNTGYTINQVIRTQTLDNTLALPELKVVDGRTSPFTATTNFGNIFNVPGLKIERQFWPLREFWLDYVQDSTYKLRVFPIAYQDQALSSDDPLGLVNHHIWWEESHWLSAWSPGKVDTGFAPVNYTQGKWDNSLSYFTRDSDGTRLTALRGASFEFTPDEFTLIADTFASPKGLWQDYEDADNIINALRIKRRISPGFSLGGLYTFRMGLNEEKQTDALNHVWGLDASWSPLEGQMLSAQVASSRSRKDVSQVFETRTRGNLYFLSFTGSNQDINPLDLKYGYEEIKPEKDPGSFFGKYRMFAAHMDEGFDPTLSNYHNTRNDSFWSRHLHFRRPYEYFTQGLYGAAMSFDDISSSAIGDGIDIGRDSLGFRLEITSADQKLGNLFDIRSVHSTAGKYVETVTRDELTYKLTDKLTVKGLGLYHDLPDTQANTDPFIFDSSTGQFLYNNTIQEGLDPSLATGSLGLEYAFTDWLAINGIWERTNDSSLAYANYPRGNSNGVSVTTYTQDGLVYRSDVPFLNNQGLYPLPPYDYFDIFKAGLRLNPTDKTQIYLDYTRNEYKSAGQISDNINHLGFEFSYLPTPRMGFYLRYVYSRWNDINRMLAGMDKIYMSHHNIFLEFRFLPGKDDEFLVQYGESGRSLFSDVTYDPFGGGLSTLDTQHILRLYYRRRF